ncbi:class I SAM-dependent methyltransferase [Pseudoalteromonas sp. OOF1S-7]|uniref:class I SAM-dependent methyltransferase n=1 Tax=Pseudoalteromonas sp. OOF1S-7 TaxID=2917757 RepID=UPI001EF4E90A|nr:class I SAM-dependent methyltransferase [Pseudoalteromonas sp. OOF1S-7]MCG7537137.1 class I SAM-dependent methyltransferase [Pseudoalteromonas sp. OOF1S-7]
MKKVFRSKQNSEYWEKRWLDSGCDKNEFSNMEIYPIKFAQLVADKADRILEAGCGTGRLYFHYKKQGKDIKGIDFSENAITAIKSHAPDAQVERGSITDLPYDSGYFDTVFAFGLYHNIEDMNELTKAFSETKRVLQPGGSLVASFRFDSVENNLIERIVRKRQQESNYNQFHRWHFTLSEIKAFLEPEILVEDVYYVRNVSFLFKFDFFRAKSMKADSFDESRARASGFQLNGLGKMLDRVLHTCFPTLFSNLIVVVGKKAAT